jgi:hypothetical protein
MSADSGAAAALSLEAPPRSGALTSPGPSGAALLADEVVSVSLVTQQQQQQQHVRLGTEKAAVVALVVGALATHVLFAAPSGRPLGLKPTAAPYYLSAAVEVFPLGLLRGRS